VAMVPPPGDVQEEEEDGAGCDSSPSGERSPRRRRREPGVESSEATVSTEEADSAGDTRPERTASHMTPLPAQAGLFATGGGWGAIDQKKSGRVGHAVEARGTAASEFETLRSPATWEESTDPREPECAGESGLAAKPPAGEPLGRPGG